MSYIGVPPFGQTVRTITELTASAGQTTFNVSGGYLPGYVDVFLNGVSLASGDFTSTNGSTVVLGAAASLNDEFKAIAYWPVSLIDTYRKSEADALLATKQAASPTLTTYASTGIGFRNRIINGDMRIDQRNAGASVAFNSSSNFGVDRFKTYNTVGSGSTVQRSTTAPAGFINSLLFTVGTGASPSASSECIFFQPIEGFNVSDLGFGTASASSVTVSFQVRSSVTGTYAFRLRNQAGNRSYVATYTVNSANTWETKSVTIAGDTSGTWATDNTIGILLTFDLGSGSDYNTTASAWQAGNYTRTSGCVNFIATSGATFYITGVQLEAGSTATSFDRRDYGRELMMCQRYYQAYPSMFQCGQAYGLGVDGFTVNFSFAVKMRAAPTSTVTNGNDGGSYATLVVSPITDAKCTFQVRNNGGGGTSKWYTWDQAFTAEL